VGQDGGGQGTGEQPGRRGCHVGGAGEDGRDVRVRAEHPGLVGPGAERLAQDGPGVEVADAVHGDGQVTGVGQVRDRRVVTHEDRDALARELAEADDVGPAGHGDRAVGDQDAGRGDGDVAAGGPAGEGPPVVGGGQGGVDVPERLGQPAGVDLGAGPRIGGGPLQHLEPVPRLLLVAGHQEPHGRPGDLEVLHGRGVPLVVVAVQQRLRRPPAEHEGELPGRVLGVEDPGVQAAGAERGEQVGGVAGHEHAAHPHPVHDAGVEPVDRLPDDLVVPVADDLADPPVESSRGLLGRQVEVRRDLPVDPEGRVGAGVDEHLAAGVPLRVEVEAPLGLPAGQVGADVADEELVAEGLAVEGEPQRGADDVGARAGAGHRVAAGDRRPVGAGDGHPAVVLVDAGDGVPPPDVDQRLGGDRLVEQFLGEALRDVDEGRERGPPAVGELEAEHLGVAVEGAGGGPGDAAAGDLGADADGVPDVEDVALLADRPAPDEVPRGTAVEHDDAQSPAGQQERRGLAHRAAPDDDDRRRRGLLGHGHRRITPAARPRPGGRARRSR
jgi:hypothetical protein